MSETRSAQRFVAWLVVLGYALLMATSVAQAAVPNAEKIANAVAKANRSSGRATPMLLDLTLAIAQAEPVATGVLATHPTGLARLELRSNQGVVDRHLLQGNIHTASRDGRRLDSPPPFLPPLFFLQATSGAALQAALISYGVAPDEVVLGRLGDRDCYVLGGRMPRGAGGEERMMPSLWVDLETFEILQIDRPDGVRFRFGPVTHYAKIRAPSWIDIESPDHPKARLSVVRLAPANAPAAAFSDHWLYAPISP